MATAFVFGSLNMDLVASVESAPRAGETVSGSGFATHPGGKGANQAVGEDGFGAQLRDFLTAQGVEVDTMTVQADAPTGTAVIVVDAAGENRIVVVPGANHLATFDAAKASLQPGDVLCAQLEVKLDEAGRALRAARDAGALAVLNPAPFVPEAESLLTDTDLLILNETEFHGLTGSLVPADADARTEAVDALRARFDLVAVVLTRGAAGVIAAHREFGIVAIDGEHVRAVDTTGAGDCFVGAFAAMTAHGAGFAEALRWANRAAALSVETPGAGPAMPTRDAVRARFGDSG